MTVKTIKKVSVDNRECQLSFDAILNSYIEFILRAPVKTVITCLLITIMAGLGVSKLFFQSDFRIFFSEENPQLKAFEDLQKIYNKPDNVLLVIEARDGEIFSRDTLTAIEKATENAWKLPFVRRVDSITNFQNSYAEEDTIVVDNLVRDAPSLTEEQVLEIKLTTLSEPLLRNRLISEQAHVTAINIIAQLPDDHGDQVKDITGAARKLSAEIEQNHPNLKTYLTGGIVMDNAFAEQSESDIKLLIPIMLSVALIFLTLVLQNIYGVIAISIVLSLSVFAALGMAGWLGIGLSPPSISAPNIIMTIAIADCVHILSCLLLIMEKQSSKLTAIHESLKINFLPVALTSLLTIVGFISLNTSDSPPFRDLGNITALGALFAFLLSISLFPALLKMLPIRTSRRIFLTQGHTSTAANWILNNRKPLFFAVSGLALLSIFLAPSNELNDEYVKYFDDNVEFRNDTDFTSNELTGIYYIDYSLENERDGTVADPIFLAQLDKFASWLSEQKETRYVFSLSEIFKKINMNMHEDNREMYRLPQNERLAAQYLALYEMSLPYGLDLNDRVRVDKKATRLTVGLDNISSQDVIDFQGRAKRWLASNAPDIMHDNGTGMSIMFAHIGQRNIVSMLTGIALALTIISLLLIGVFRSVKLGLISLIPNLVPAIMAFGLWALIDGQVGLAVSAVAAMTLGIVVDDTVHFLSKFLYARKQLNKNIDDSLRYALTTVGSALVITTIALAVGFLILTVSHFEINASMGLLTAIVFIFALITDLLLLPYILTKTEVKTT